MRTAFINKINKLRNKKRRQEEFHRPELRIEPPSSLERTKENPKDDSRNSVSRVIVIDLC